MDRKKLSWYLDRLSKMSLKETFWRLDLLVNQPDLSKMRQIPLDVASSEMKKSAPTLGAKPTFSFDSCFVNEKTEKVTCEYTAIASDAYKYCSSIFRIDFYALEAFFWFI